jgi:hypothetical protein
MEETATKESWEKADELLRLSNKELMAVSLAKNSNWSENYHMAITIRLIKTLHSFNRATKISSVIMIGLTIIIAIFTIVFAIKE